MWLFSNALSPTLVTVPGITMWEVMLLSAKAYVPMEVTAAGMVTEVRAEVLKRSAAIAVSPTLIVACVSWVHC